jgi:hypothetical protein
MDGYALALGPAGIAGPAGIVLPPEQAAQMMAMLAEHKPRLRTAFRIFRAREAV